MIFSFSNGNWGLLAASAAVAVWALLNHFGLIPKGTVSKAAQERADNAEWELAKKIQEGERLRGDIDHLKTRVEELEGQTNLDPLLERLERLTSMQERTLNKLEQMNGSIKRTGESLESSNEALRVTVEAVKFVAGQLMSGTMRVPADN